MITSFIAGPGQHKNDFVKVGQTLFNEFHVFEHYPVFKKKTYEKAQLISEYTNLWWKLTEKKHALQYLKLSQHTGRYHEKVLDSFARFTATHIAKNSNMVIGWPQVSHTSFKLFSGRVPLVLDYPMIHPLAWQQILKEYLLTHEVHHERYLFSNEMLDKMLSEIEAANCIVVLSEFAKNTFLQQGVSASKIQVNPLPVENNYSYVPVNHSSPQIQFLFAGRIDYLKGMYDLEAFLSQSAHNKYTFILAGEAQDQQIAEKLKQKPNTKLTGYLSIDKLVPLMRESDFLILPSVQESFGRVVLNALALGTPVIVSNRCIASDVVNENNGFIFEAGNVQDLTATIEKAASNIDLWREKRAAIAETVKNYTFESYFGQWKTIFKQYE